MKRIPGGISGFLSAIEAGKLDPEDPAPVDSERFFHRTNSERRAADLRAHRKAKKQEKRSPF